MSLDMILVDENASTRLQIKDEKVLTSLFLCPEFISIFSPTPKNASL